jgi:adenosylcobinamide-phosphate synthase
MLWFSAKGAVMMLLALGLDRLLAEPRRWHPLVGFGLLAQQVERVLRTLLGRHLRLAGMIALLLMLSPALLLAASWPVISGSTWVTGIVNGLLATVLLYHCLGFASLLQHIGWIEQALDEQNIEQARCYLSWIVSRDTSTLNQDEIAQAALESLLENSVDALFASLFWFAVAGPAAALLHRWSNTLDAMWGYRNERYRQFGWAAARLDDVLAWLPARLTALSFILLRRRGTVGWRCWRQQASACASPNGGVVMCVGAGVLGVRLSRGGWYQQQWQPKPDMGEGPRASRLDLARGRRLVHDVLVLWCALWVAVALW